MWRRLEESVGIRCGLCTPAASLVLRVAVQVVGLVEARMGIGNTEAAGGQRGTCQVP